MTGFGKAIQNMPSLTITVEVKALNAKHLETHIKTDNVFSEKELEIRHLIEQKLGRGRVTVLIDYTAKRVKNSKMVLNIPLLAAYHEELCKAGEALKIDQEMNLFTHILKMPGVWIKEKDDDRLQQDWLTVKATLVQALAACDGFRMQEGRVLKLKFEAYIKRIFSLLDEIILHDPVRITKIRRRLEKQIKEFKEKYKHFGTARFEQELFYYIDKLDISEEKTRINSHLNYFIETMELAQSRGKKLGFISQEIGREINTIGSKANDVNIQKLVVSMKEELEKIKEQVSNIL